jgi:hypothetical protein
MILLGMLKAILAFVAVHHFWKAHSDPKWVIAISNPAPGNAQIRSIDARNYEKRWKDRRRFIYVFVLLIGYGVVVYTLCAGLLSFLPDDWGSVDEDGQYTSFRHGFSIAVAGIGAFVLPQLAISYAEKMIKSQRSTKSDVAK